jgi:hypothetical protein
LRKSKIFKEIAGQIAEQIPCEMAVEIEGWVLEKIAREIAGKIGVEITEEM